MESIIGKKIRTTPFLTKEEIAQLFDRLAAGDKRAEKILFESHLALVKKLALKIANRSILTVDDLEQEGAIGLLQAIRYFDPSRNGDFLLFAYFAVNQIMISSLINSSPVMRVPQNKIKDARNFKKVADRLNQKFCRQATFEEIAAACRTTAKNVAITWQSVFNGHVYLSDKVTKENERRTYEDILADKTCWPYDNEVEIYERIMEIIYQLDKQEQQVLKLHFGLKDRNNGYNPCLGNWDIGQRLDKKISAERVRQIKERALQKVRRKLRSYFIRQAFIELNEEKIVDKRQKSTSL